MNKMKVTRIAFGNKESAEVRSFTSDSNYFILTTIYIPPMGKYEVSVMYLTRAELQEIVSIFSSRKGHLTPTGIPGYPCDSLTLSNNRLVIGDCIHKLRGQDYAKYIHGMTKSLRGGFDYAKDY